MTMRRAELPLPRLSPSTGKDRLLIAAICLFAAYDIAYLTAYAMRHALPATPLPFGDFAAFWSFAHFARTEAPASIYDPATLQAFQRNLLPGFADFYPFPYPPSFLLLLYPLGSLGYGAACALWIGSTFAGFLAAALSWLGRSWSLALALVAPTTLLALISGQNGFFAAALLLGGLRLLGSRPFLAGALLGCLSFKPQLLVVVPLVLLAARNWRAVAGLLAATLTLGLASAALFGQDIWLAWVKAVPALWQLFEANRPKLAPLMPTVSIAALSAGFSATTAKVVQAIVSGAVLLLLLARFRGARREGPSLHPLDCASLVVGSFLATPYAFIYDMPGMGVAIALTLGAMHLRGVPATAGESAIVIAALLFPLIMFAGLAGSFPIGVLALMLLFALVIRLRGGLAGRQASAARPSAEAVLT